MRRPLVILALLAASCGPKVPPAPAISLESFLIKEADDDGFRELVAAADIADEVYNLIADTPIKEIEARSSEIGKMVTDARDRYRRARSYPLGELRFNCVPGSKGVALPFTSKDDRPVRFSVGGAKRVKLQVEPNPYWSDRLGIHVDYSLVSSRGQRITEIPCTLSTVLQDVDSTVVADQVFTIPISVTRSEFSRILQGDSVNIPDLVANIKR